MTAPYAVRRLNFSFTLGTGSFGESGSTPISISGLRAVVHIDLANMPDSPSAQMYIYGMTLDHMNQLSKAGLNFATRVNNSVTIQAGDDVEGMSTVYSGMIVEAYPNMKGMPDTSFFVSAIGSPVAQMKPVEPTSFSGATSAVVALTVIAKKMDLPIENNEVNTVLASPYFEGTAWDQVMNCVRAADCFAYQDTINKVLAIWPKSGSRAKGPVVVSTETGMIGYPQFQQSLVIVRTVYNKLISSGVGQIIEIQSQLESANGKFVVNSVSADLSSELPDGPWEMTIIANPV